MTTINASSAPRIGLLGNPSDLFGGRGLAFTFDAFSAEVSLRPNDAIRLADDEATTPMEPLIAAGWRIFREQALAYLEPDGLAEPPAPTAGALQLGDARRGLEVPPFAVRARCDIPRQAGLSGSSALLTALLRALAAWCGQRLPAHRLAELAWRAEQELLGIRAGPMDRLVQAHEGLVWMDFAEPWRPTATRRLDPALLPPMVMAWRDEPGQGSGAVHHDVYERWAAGDPRIVDHVRRWPPLVDEGLAALRSGDRGVLIDCVNRNFDLRAALYPIDESDRRMIELGREAGAGTKLCGSGGAVLAVCPDEATRDQLLGAYRAAGFQSLSPRVRGAPPARGRLRAVILAAGFAKRLYPLTREQAKPLLEVGGASMLTRLAEQLAATEALADVVVVHNARFGEAMRSWARSLPPGSPPVRLVDNAVVDDDRGRGAVADLALALQRAPPPPEDVDGFIVLAGDNLLDLSLEPVARAFLKDGAPRLVVRRLPEPVPPSRYNEVEVDGAGRVTRFREKPAEPGSPRAALAVYLLPGELPSLVDAYLAEEGVNRDAPGYLMEWLCQRLSFVAEPVPGRWFDIGNREQLDAARAWMDARST